MTAHKKGSTIMSLMKDKHKKLVQRKSQAQSLVEFAITLPVLLLLFSGLVEFGFALNYYLSLLDATREAARFYSNSTPFLDDGVTENPAFYTNVAAEVYANLDPTVRPGNEAYQGRRIVLDPTADDILVSAYGWNTSDPDNLIPYPTSGPFRQWNNPTGSKVTQAMILAQLPDGSPSAGLLLVEVHFHYNPLLVRLMFSEPLLMRAYTIMPFNAVEPR
jgi:hypothetical protein